MDENNNVIDLDSIVHDSSIQAIRDSMEALPPEFPILKKEAFHGLAGDVARLATKDSEADPTAVLMSFLSMVSAVFGGDKYLAVGETKVPARLFVALAGNSSRARKGTSLKPVIRILDRAEEILGYEIDIYKPLRIGDGGLSSAEGLIWQVRDEAEEKDKKGVPVWEGVEDKRILIVEEEMGNVLKIAQREGNTLSPMLRRSWDGGILAPMTKNNRLKSSYPHICILSHITRYELTSLLSGTEIYNGLANRFLWCCVRRTKILPFPKPMDDKEVNRLSSNLAECINKNINLNKIILSDNAYQLWKMVYKDISVDYQGVVGAITARAEAHVLRLAMVYCLLDGDIQIKEIHIVAAMAIWDYCKASAIYLFSFNKPEERDPDTHKILEALKVKDLSQTEVSNLFARNKKTSELNRILSDLESSNLIKQVEIKTKGRPIRAWKLINK